MKSTLSPASNTHNQGWGAGSILTRLTPAPALAQNRPALAPSTRRGRGRGKREKLQNFE